MEKALVVLWLARGSDRYCNGQAWAETDLRAELKPDWDRTAILNGQRKQLRNHRGERSAVRLDGNARPIALPNPESGSERNAYLDIDIR